MLKSLYLAVAMCSLSAFAGFRGYNGSSDLKLFSSVQCSTGLSCSKGTKDKFTVVATGLGVLRTRVLAAASTLTSAQCGSTFYNAGAVELDLPDASGVIGCRYTFVTLNAANFDIDPDAADIILVQTDAVGDRARNATVGNSITIEAVSASQWAVVGILGTWSDAN